MPSGHSLPYTAQYDQSTHSIQTFLPDGSYTLLVTAVGAQSRLSSTDSRRMLRAQVAMLGQAGVSVAGRAVSNLRVPISLSQGNPVQVNVTRTGTQAPHSGVFVTLSQTGGWISDAHRQKTYAQGTSAGPLGAYLRSRLGSYWAHTAIAQKSLLRLRSQPEERVSPVKAHGQSAWPRVGNTEHSSSRRLLEPHTLSAFCGGR